jgi:hypothetical protein
MEYSDMYYSSWFPGTVDKFVVIYCRVKTQHTEVLYLRTKIYCKLIAGVSW